MTSWGTFWLSLCLLWGWIHRLGTLFYFLPLWGKSGLYLLFLVCRLPQSFHRWCVVCSQVGFRCMGWTQLCWLPEWMFFPLCLLARTCCWPLHTALLLCTWVWCAGTVGVVAFVALCVGNVRAPQGCIVAMRHVLGVACSPNQCPFPSSIFRPNLASICSVCWELLAGVQQVPNHHILCQNCQRRAWMI